MDYRAFSTADGVAWHVWPVHPTMIERRNGRERRATMRAGEARRQVDEIRFVRADTMADGWLVFQSKHELRRLAPARDDIDILSDTELSDLVSSAKLYGAPRRLIAWAAT